VLRRIHYSTKAVILLLVIAVFGIAAYFFVQNPHLQSDHPSPNPVSTSPNITPTSNVQTINETYPEACVSDTGAYTGNCKENYVCFKKGSDQGCPKGKDCSNIKFTPVGDDKCHKICQLNNNCPSGYTCKEKEVWHGDYGEKYKICL
jgi:hypothetical protein